MFALQADWGPVFVYGPLLLPAVWGELIGRVPEMARGPDFLVRVRDSSKPGFAHVSISEECLWSGISYLVGLGWFGFGLEPLLEAKWCFPLNPSRRFGSKPNPTSKTCRLLWLSKPTEWIRSHETGQRTDASGAGPPGRRVVASGAGEDLGLRAAGADLLPGGGACSGRGPGGGPGGMGWEEKGSRGVVGGGYRGGGGYELGGLVVQRLEISFADPA